VTVLLTAVGRDRLQLHPDQTRVVYCKDSNRRRKDCAETSFTFLGYTFRA
jgi:RNA-directed DNA polymerase